MAKFRIKKGATLPYNDGQSAKVYREGEEVDLPLHVAADVANRWMLEPLDDQARYALMPVETQDPAVLARTSAAHERVQMLSQQVKDTEGRLSLLKDQLAQAEKEQAEVAEQAKAGKPQQTGQMIGGVPVTVLDHGTGEGVSANVVHGEPTQLKPGESAQVQPVGSQPPPQQAATASGRGVADQSPTRDAATRGVDVQSR